MAARRAQAKAAPGKSRKDRHALQVDKEVSRQIGDEKPVTPTKAVTEAPKAKKLTTSTENKAMFKLTNQDLEHELSVAKQRGETEHAHTLQIELAQRKAKIKEVLGQANSAKDFVRKELPNVKTDEQYGRFLTRLTKIMPSLGPRLEKIRNSPTSKRLREVKYFDAIVESTFQTIADHIVGGLLTGVASGVGISIFSNGRG